MKLQTFGAALFKARHYIGAMVALAVAWVPLNNGLRAYEPISSHGECGFLCIFLIEALSWWFVAIVIGALVWCAIAWVLHFVGDISRAGEP